MTTRHKRKFSQPNERFVSTVVPTPAPPIPKRLAPCPDCPARSMEPCLNPDGSVRGDHFVRRRMSVRAYMAQDPDGDRSHAQQMTPAMRRAHREWADLLIKELAKIIDVHETTLRYWETGQSQPTGVAAIRYGKWLKENPLD